MMLRRTSEAIPHFERSLSVFSRSVNVWSCMASCWLDNREFEKALTCCDHAIEVDPNMPAAWVTRGLACDRLQRHAEASDCFSRYLQLMGKDAKGCIQFGFLTRWSISPSMSA